MEKNKILNSIKQSEEAAKLWNAPTYKAKRIKEMLLLVIEEGKKRGWDVDKMKFIIG
jgi:hypothetical protein